MENYNEELIIQFLLNCELATSHAITEKLNIKHPVVIECLIKLKKEGFVANMNQDLINGKLVKFWRLTKEARDYLTSD